MESKFMIRYRKNVKRDSSDKVISESDNWIIGFNKWEDYQEWKAKQKNIRIVSEEKI